MTTSNSVCSLGSNHAKSSLHLLALCKGCKLRKVTSQECQFFPQFSGRVLSCSLFVGHANRDAVVRITQLSTLPTENAAFCYQYHNGKIMVCRYWTWPCLLYLDHQLSTHRSALYSEFMSVLFSINKFFGFLCLFFHSGTRHVMSLASDN